MQCFTMRRYPSYPKCLNIAYVAAIEAPVLVPVSECCFLDTRYGVDVASFSICDSCLKSNPLDGIVPAPILCGSTIIEDTPSTPKSNGCFLSRNGITRPPNAASTCRYTLLDSASSASSSMGSICPNSVVPAIPTRATVLSSIKSSTDAGHTL